MSTNPERTLFLSENLSLPLSEVQWTAVRSQGAGGQNVNKVATAVQIQFDIQPSSLPEKIKERLLTTSDQRISQHGVIMIKSQEHRSQDKNLSAGLERLKDMIVKASIVPKKRRPTKPTKGSQTRRLDSKGKRSDLKNLRKKL
jgi:ribosome-associated protein